MCEGWGDGGEDLDELCAEEGRRDVRRYEEEEVDDGVGDVFIWDGPILRELGWEEGEKSGEVGGRSGG